MTPINHNNTFIYALLEPLTNEVRYIGKSDNPWDRLYVGNNIHIPHIKDKSNTYKAHWIQSLVRKEIVPTLTILEQCKKDVWQEREKDWITFYKKLGYKLTNATNGGEGVSGKRSEETKRKISDALRRRIRKPLTEKQKDLLRGRIQSIEERKRRSDAAKKRYIENPEDREKMSKLHKGSKRSEESKKHMSEIKKGKPPNNKGKKRSIEAIRKAAESNRGKSRNKGRIQTKEERIKRTKIWENKSEKDKYEIKKRISEACKKRLLERKII